MTAVTCQIQAIQPLTDHVFQVLLKPEMPRHFKPGQYLNVVMNEEDKRPFSIASTADDEFIELQIGAFAADGYAMQVIEKLKNSDEILVEMPFGQAYLREDSKRDILLLAGGTGFSYVRSMLAHLSQQKSPRKVILYWGLREQSACYQLEQTQALIDTMPNAEFHLVLEQAPESWQGKQGLVHQVAMENINNLADYDIYLAGRFDMVAQVRQDFVAKGANIERMFADAFAFI